MKLSAMKEFLAGADIRLTKSLGQNFLHEQNQLHRIVAAAELKRSDRVLEVGPGLGPLTELLLLEASEVLAIEMDGRLVEFLKNKFGSNKNLTLRHDDALRFLQTERRDWSHWKLVANLPYSVASPILVELAEAPKTNLVRTKISRCGTTMPCAFCRPNDAIGRTGNSWRTFLTRWRRRFWWSWPRHLPAPRAWWPRCKSKSPSASRRRPTTGTTAS